MATRFDDWEEEYLEHYGIPGMKWGVRRFQNSDGTLTAAGQKRYGTLGTGANARKMTKHLNKLDMGYANVEARRRSAAYSTGRHAIKMNKALAKGNIAKATKEKAKALKAGHKAAELNRTKQNIESLQWRILGHAAKRGYTVSSEPVRRIGQDGKTRVAGILGGALGTLAYSAAKKGRNVSSVDGQKFTVSRRGDRTQSFVNYRAMNSEGVRKLAKEDRDRELYEQLRKARR